jgi:uncharacterized membrane protein
VFILVFSFFLLALLVLVVVTVRWAVHRDRERRSPQRSSEAEGP